MMKNFLKQFTFACLLFYPFVSAQAVTVNLSKTADNNVAISIPATLGFFKVQPDASNTGLYGLVLKDPENNSQFKITADDLVSGSKNNLLNSSVLYNQVVNDFSHPGQKVRRIKVTFDKLVIASNTVLPLGTHNFDVYLINQNGDVISDMAEEVSDTSVPIEFTGGNGQPLTIYIEDSFAFNNLDLDKLPSHSIIYLDIYSKKPFSPSQENGDTYTINASSCSVNYVQQFGDTIRQNYYRDGFADWQHSSLIVKQHDIYIDALSSSFDENIKSASINFFPFIYIVQHPIDMTPPKSGWYKTQLAFGDHLARDTHLFKPLDAQAVSTNTPLESQATYLLTHGDTFQFSQLPSNVFQNERFFVVSSVDADGRIRLKEWRPNISSAAKNRYPAEAFDFSGVTDGNMVWWGNLGRWLTTDANGHNKVHEGYFGWHAADGSYAFLRVNNEDINSTTLPKVGSLIAFEYMKN